MIARFFLAPPNTRRIPVTEASVSPEKEGMGILIRKIVRKRPRCFQPKAMKELEVDEQHCSSSNFDEKRGGSREEVANTNTEAEKETDDDIATNDNNDSIKPTRYLPRPGDFCVIRFDCYVLSPLSIDRNRHGHLRISESQQFQDRKRTWVDGNFERPPLIEATKESQYKTYASNAGKRNGAGENVDGHPYTSVQEDPYHDGETSGRSRLGLPALEFEVGAGDVICGLDVVVQRMVQGEVVEATIPHLYAYGSQGLYPRIPPKADLFFVVQLEKVIPSDSNAKAAYEGNARVKFPTIRRVLSRDLIFFCCGLVEGIFIVLFGVAIPIFLLLRSELDLEDIIRELVGAQHP